MNEFIIFTLNQSWWLVSNLFNFQDHIHMAKGNQLKSGTKFNCDLVEMWEHFL